MTAWHLYNAYPWECPDDALSIRKLFSQVTYRVVDRRGGPRGPQSTDWKKDAKTGKRIWNSKQASWAKDLICQR